MATLDDSGNGEKDSYVFGRDNPTVKNCYYLDAGNFAVNQDGKQFSEDQIATGELAYMLNNMRSDTAYWYQNIDNELDIDEFPVPDPTHGIVYAVGTVNCKGEPTSSDGYSNTNSTVTLPHVYEEGVCSVCGDVKDDYLQAGSDKFYEIKTPGELNWFFRYVNKGNYGVNGKLAADIDFSKYSADSVMIGKSDVEASSFTGIFDGQGHTITVAYDRYNQGAALFMCAADATIRNLVVDGTISCGFQGGGIINNMYRHTIVENCLSLVKFTSKRVLNEDGTPGDASIGGVVVSSQGPCIIRNCGFAGTVTAPQGTGCGGILAFANSGVQTIIENCYVATDMDVYKDEVSNVIARNNPTVLSSYYTEPTIAAVSQSATMVTADQVANGELAFMLNKNVAGGTPWLQTIGVDDSPYPTGDHSKVYATGDVSCDGSIISVVCTNTEATPNRPEHSYNELGICENCYSRLISTPEQLIDASTSINAGVTSAAINITLANDIDMAGVIDYLGIGTRDIPFTGHFDGQGHVIRNLVIATDQNDQGLIGMAAGGAIIENVTVDSTCSISAGSYAAGIVAGTNGQGLITIRNCGNEAPITVNAESGVNAAGIVGVNMGSSALLRIQNCYNTGKISGHAESAGICGWLGQAAELTSVYNIGEVTGVQGDRTFARFDSNPTFTNCYETIGNQVTNVNSDFVKSGALCYALNDSTQGGAPFFQTIATQDHPVLHLSSDKVYEVNGAYTNDITRIAGVKADSKANVVDGVTRIYTTDGVRIPALRKGVNIVRGADGTVKKVLVK